MSNIGKGNIVFVLKYKIRKFVNIIAANRSIIFNVAAGRITR